MKFDDALEFFGDRPWFDFEMALLLSREKAPCIHTDLYRWRQGGKLTELRRGLFVLAEPWRRQDLHPSALACAIYPPSYLTGRWVLEDSGVLPRRSQEGQGAPRCTSATARPAQSFENAFGVFSYETLPRDLLFGASFINPEDAANNPTRAACPEKALLDFCFIEGGEWTQERFEAEGFAPGILAPAVLEAMAARARRPRLSRAAKAFARYAARSAQGDWGGVLGTRTLGPEPQLFGHMLSPRGAVLETAMREASPEGRRAILRERVQAAVLRSLHESGAFGSLCLSGQAALRFALGGPSFAAELSFFVVDKKDYRPEKWLFAAQRRLRFMGLNARIAFARRPEFHSGWIRIPDLLAEAGLSDSPAEELGVKITIELAAPQGAVCEIGLSKFQEEHFALRYWAEKSAAAP